MIGIIDYEVGNLFNVQRGLERVGLDSIITRDPKKLRNAEAIILPGVGACRDAMENLHRFDLVEEIRKNVKDGKLFFGICLGMQLLFEKSYEGGEFDCLSLMEGEVVPFETDLKIPHMGWNTLKIHKESPLVKGIDGRYVYFVHSFLLDPKYNKNIIASTEYDGVVPAITGKDNVYGMQFHPEKSGETGMMILQNMKKMIKGE